MIIDRIYQIIDYKDITANEFSKKMAFSNGYLAKTRKNKGGVGGHIIEKIVRYHPEINPTWLLTGEGEMLKSGAEGKTDGTYSKNLDKVGVPYYDVDFIGGFDLVLNDQTIQPSYYINFAPFNDADCYVNVTGKSMSPFISHGDIVALKKLEEWNKFLPLGEIYAIITKEHRTIKIVSKGDTPDTFKLIPYSKSAEFSPQEIPKSIITGVFKVKGSLKKF